MLVSWFHSSHVNAFIGGWSYMTVKAKLRRKCADMFRLVWMGVSSFIWRTIFAYFYEDCLVSFWTRPGWTSECPLRRRDARRCLRKWERDQTNVRFIRHCKNDLQGEPEHQKRQRFFCAALSFDLIRCWTARAVRVRRMDISSGCREEKSKVIKRDSELTPPPPNCFSLIMHLPPRLHSESALCSENTTVACFCACERTSVCVCLTHLSQLQGKLAFMCT